MDVAVEDSSWQYQGDEISCAVRDLAAMPVEGSQPVRRFGWRARHKDRPGLQFLVSTGRHHGFDSLDEQRLLLALDFAGAVIESLPQPFRLSYETAAGGRGEHIPDFLAVSEDGGGWLFDVRPGELIGDDDVTEFAAAHETALANGRHYSVVAGWGPHVGSVLDAFSAQRRELVDRLGLADQLLNTAVAGPRRFVDLVNANPSQPCSPRKSSKSGNGN
ncbi:hypothetical protein ACWF9G_15555 [Nocardia sp. NPDC055029]